MFGLFKKKPLKEPEPYQGKILFNPKEKHSAPHLGSRQNILSKFKNTIIGFLGLAFIMASAFGIYTVFNSEQFKIKNFEFIGNKEVEDSEITEVIQSFKGKSLFLVNASVISETVSRSFPLFKSVEVKKVFPDLLRLVIAEKDPQLVLINLSGSYVIDEEGFVIEVISSDNINFPADKIEIARGLGDPNSESVRERIYADWKAEKKLIISPNKELTPEDEQRLAKEFNFAAIADEEKEATLKTIQEELLHEITSFLDSHALEVSQTVFAGLPRVYVINADILVKNQIISEKKLNLTAEVARFFNQNKQLVVEKIFWEGEVLVRFQFTSGKQIVFGTNRKVSEQLEDLLLVSSKLEQEGKIYNLIDVSSRKILVK